MSFIPGWINIILPMVAPEVEAPVGYRYWRIYITSLKVEGSNPADETQAAMGELHFHTEVFGPNIALGGVAISDTEDGAYIDDNAFDELIFTNDVAGNNMWRSTDTALPHWIGYDFGVGNAVMVVAAGLHGTEEFETSTLRDRRPNDFDVQHSEDGVTWETAWSVTDADIHPMFGYLYTVDPEAEEPVYSGSPHGAHTYWRIYCLREIFTSSSEVGAGEMEMRSTPGGADQCTGGSVASSSYFTTVGPWRLFDNNLSTNWLTADNRRWGWVRYTFTDPIEIAEVMIRNHSSIPTNTPRNIYIQYSDDDEHWTTAWAENGIAEWAAGTTRVFTDPNYI
jgi:hypothetical protein